MRPTHIEDVLVSLHSGPWFGWSDSHNKVYENLVIHSDDEKPAKQWLEEELVRQQGVYDNDYVRKRKEEYPSIEECVHAILDDDLVALQEKRAAVKARYPK